MENNHEKKIEAVEAEIAELERQIKKLEFQHKRDIAEANSRFDQYSESIKKDNAATARHLKHLSQLAGITFEELDALDDRLESASVSLSRKNKRSK